MSVLALSPSLGGKTQPCFLILAKGSDTYADKIPIHIKTSKQFFKSWCLKGTYFTYGPGGVVSIPTPS